MCVCVCVADIFCTLVPPELGVVGGEEGPGEENPGEGPRPATPGSGAPRAHGAPGGDTILQL